MAAVRTDSAARLWAGAVLFLGAIALGGSLMYAQVPSAEPPVAPPAEPPREEDKVAEVRIVGHNRVAIEKILPHVRTRKGRLFSADVLEEDVRRLNGTHLFVNVKPYVQKTEAGRVVIFEVLERPLLEYVKYVGNYKVSKKTLLKESGLKTGDPMDPFAVEEARNKIEAYYQSKGFSKAQITINEGNKTGDRGAVFLIDEGPKQKILWTKFEGNSIASDEKLKTQIQSKPGVFWLFKGTLDRKQLEEDTNRLTAYYRGLGFFQARVGRPLLDFNEGENWVTITFVIHEGPRFQVRNVSVIGNDKFKSDVLLGELKLKPGQYFNQMDMNADKATMQDIYGAVGYVFADISPDPRFLENEPGKLDLVYRISEGARYRVGRVDVSIKGLYPHTRINTVLNRLSVQPGDIVDTRELRSSERRLKASGLFKDDPASGSSPKIVFSAPSQEKEESIARRPKGPAQGFRGQSPDPADQVIDVTFHGESNHEENPGPWYQDMPPAQPGVAQPATAPEDHSSQAAPPLRWGQPMRQEALSPQPHFAAQMPVAQAYAQPAPVSPVAQTPRQPLIVRGQYSSEGGWSTPSLPQSTSTGPRASLFGGQSSSSTTYSGLDSSRATNGWATNNAAVGGAAAGGAAVRGGTYVQPQPAYSPAASNGVVRPISNNGPGMADGTSGLAPGALPLSPNPDVSNALPSNRPWDDTRELPLNSIVEDTETGRLMFSVGVNSESGLIGSVVIDEQNFDWTRFPTSWEEIRNRTALRGAGQRFRMEATPGTVVQKYAISFQEPYLFDSQVSLALSGFYYDRIYDDWTEERLGGRVALGYQFTHDLSGTLAYRGAKVELFNPSTNGIPALDDALGASALHGFQIGLTHDTRDNRFLATEGHLIEATFEQVIGTYQYPRAELEARQYFLMRQHPDGSGRHVVSVGGRVGYTGDNTPIYDHFFAGGFSTIRGFRYRGASPIEYSSTTGLDVRVGGEFQLLASIEYMFPITADDTLRGVVFCDTGTVEPNINNWSDRYRVAPGFGLRITIPMMGPAPIALDLAFPVAYNNGDRQEAFSFWIGFLR